MSNSNDSQPKSETDGRSIAIIAFTRRGCNLATVLAEGLARRDAYAGVRFSVHGPEKFAEACGVQAYENLASWTAERFPNVEALLFVGASGIAVRAIAPHVRDKFTDPAVVSIDEAGRFAVPLLSGHVGGANELARAVAEIAGGQAAVSTATDVNRMFAVDEWAARNGLQILERTIAREISARLLEGGTVGYTTDVEGPWRVPSDAVGVVQGNGSADSPAESQARVSDLGFAVTLNDRWQPFERTLHLVPCCVTVGVGCRRDTVPEVLAAAVDAALEAAGVSDCAVARLASIDVKGDEEAILQLAANRGWDLRFYSAEELAAVPGDFAASDFVKRTVGVDNVCERAALAEGGRLLLGKQSGQGTTVALAVGDTWNGDGCCSAGAGTDTCDVPLPAPTRTTIG